LADRSEDLETPEALAWAELQRRGTIKSRYLRDLKEEVAGELAHCLDPHIHEQDIRPYGVVVCRETPPLARLGRLLNTDGLEEPAIRSLADGRHSFVLLVKDQPLRLLLLHEGIDTDQDYASRAVWVEGVIICNDERGIVRIVTDSSVTMVEGRRWIAKDLVFEAAEDILQVVPVADAAIVRRLLELCHHRISPPNIGATLVYLLTPHQPADTHHDAGVSVAALGLSILNENEEPLLLHQARYRDGAMIIGHDGTLLAVNVILRSTPASDRAVPARTGTRHTSAARHTYDRPDVLAFVVSQDGPVTVFSDGKRIAELKMSGADACVPKTLDTIQSLAALRGAGDRLS
jgi:DNA integrity scanning protein DisA with diadenylate cyclase activity